MPIKISVVIPVKNEEARIRRCLDSLKSWADEIVVVDDSSSDQTVAIAREYGATVLTHALGQDWGRQRNVGAVSSQNDWILQLDADEVVPEDTATKIKNQLATDNAEAAFSLTRVNVLFGKQLIHCGCGDYVRLYNRRFASWEGNVHEQLMVKGTTGKIHAVIEHYPVDSLEFFLSKNLAYAKISAAQFLAKEKEMDIKKVKDALTFKALKLFWKSYVRKKGYKDGMPGLVWCIMNVMTTQMFWLMVYEMAQKGGNVKK